MAAPAAGTRGSGCRCFPKDRENELKEADVKKICSIPAALALLAAVAIAAAVTAHAAGETRTFVTLDEKHSQIAPGVSEDIKFVRKENGQQLVYYAMTVDVTREDLTIGANYRNNEYREGDYGIQKTTEQMAAAERNHGHVQYYTLVGGMNADTYNMNTGEPSGAFAMEGHIYRRNNARYPFFFAMRKNGEAVIGRTLEDWNRIQESDNPIWEAIGGWHNLVQSGVNVAVDWDSKQNARAAIGIKPGGEVVMLVADGKQMPFSEGCNMTELASIFLEMGCVDAVNLDGGGSTTYISRPEGERNYKVVNRPCDGDERAVSTSLMVISTFPPSDEFERAAVDADTVYITPGGTVNLTAAGISPAGTPVDIPGDVEWAVKDGKGSVDGDAASAVFTAENEPADVTVQMMRSGEEVGSIVIHVVKPTGFSFASPSIAVPYGKSIDIPFSAVYRTEGGEYTVALHQGDVTVTLEAEREMGTVTGTRFEAKTMAEDDPSSLTGTLKARLECAGLEAEASLTVGRGSEVLEGFDDNYSKTRLSQWRAVNSFTVDLDIVDRTNGKVHDGTHALKVTIDYSKLYASAVASGVWQMYAGTSSVNGKDLTGATGYGCWVWIPDEDDWSVQGMYNSKNYHLDETTNRTGINYDEGRWHYVNYPLDGFSGQSINATTYFLTICLYGQASDAVPIKSQNNKLVYYVDTITADYSAVTPDRQMPVIGEVRALLVADSYGVLTRDSIYEFEDTNEVQFTAQVSDFEDLNTTGIAGVEAWIDGVQVPAKYAAGKLVTDPVTLAPGEHVLKLYAIDGADNRTNATRRFRITQGSAATVKVVPKDPSADKIPINSLYWINVEATDVSKIQSVSLDMDLNNISEWELDHAEVDPKFDFEWEFADSYNKDENIATVTLTRKPGEDWEETDSSVLVSMPVRTWGSQVPFQTAEGTPWTAERAWSEKKFFPIDINLEVDRGQITCVKGYEPGVEPVFGGSLQVDTELYHFSEVVTDPVKNPDAAGKNSWHTHTPEELEDQEATCTQEGWSDRTFCSGCSSVVDWGTTHETVPHRWALNGDSLMACQDCEKLCNEEVEGVIYRSGVPLEGWQEDDTCYAGGRKLTGTQTVEDLWYSFGEDGVCAGRKPITGFFVHDGATYYAEAGVMRKAVPGDENSDWIFIGEDGYHIGDDGHVHNAEEPGNVPPIHFVDNRKCLVSGYKIYTCPECGDTHSSELLWYEGHKWKDPGAGDYTCTVCGTRGIDIAGCEVEFAGTYFTYTGGAILAKHTLTYRNEDGSIRTLWCESDRDGRDGLSTYTDNVNVGIATLKVEGRGDFYGEIYAQFEIVPASVGSLRCVETEHGSLELSWDQAPGAEYYAVWHRKNEQGDWTELVPRVDGTSYTVTGLEMGERYAYRVASRTDVNGRTFYSTNWSTTVSGVMDHDWIDSEEQSKAPTCTEDGILVHTCALCGETETLTLPALGHSVAEDGWTVTKEPTRSQEGEKTGTCTRCGETVTETIPKLPPVSSGSGGSTSPSHRQETVTNPDGSKTTTTKDRDGTVTETTKYEDGSVTEKVTEKDGTVKETATDRDGVTGSKETDPEGRITKAEVTVPEDAASGREGPVKAPLEIPAAERAEDAPAVHVTVQGGGKAAVEIPVPEFGPGTVAVLVNDDGSETVLRDCVLGENGVIFHVDGSADVKIVDRTEVFADVDPAAHWAADAVEFAAARELFRGTGNGMFTPGGDMTRAMLVSVLHRLVYEPDAASKGFADIPSGAWYAEAVAWAAREGVVSGYSPREFGPEDSITREQLATILYRHAQNTGLADGQSGSLAGFADAGSVSGFAQEAMAWAAGTGLVSGTDSTHLSPLNRASRAEVAAIMMRFCELAARQR